jgi:hypothetical protein
MKRTITKEQIKAIRITQGFTPDLRIELKGINKSSMYDFIDSIAINLFGIDMANAKYDENSLLSDKYERAIWICVDAVCSGHERVFEV